ncbi:uncharacterized protein BO95DRAFT_121256 [Aspergillus brunneoviolaceus CBS 621.78]|uniref:Uncharacterized protein n=1 Tax=Aspergillus brunneoviolaceus CBS 621.78 TaxID=1450534 RepID=A0ACD1G9V5_9EURO|nr:hypothetical protein BO95DRAFT_121256 [Aspergillus brunneoviolaceus CBS 621.78]RAH46018.1 hypothetical protein BO95DRAFT_121256 [Aspergillus brunneoviolaceus CBS 621.78]
MLLYMVGLLIYPLTIFFLLNPVTSQVFSDISFQFLAHRPSASIPRFYLCNSTGFCFS